MDLELSTAHLRALSDGLRERTGIPGIRREARTVQDDDITQFLLEKYVQNIEDPALAANNQRTLGLFNSAEKRKRANDAQLFLDTQPSLHQFAKIDERTGALTSKLDKNEDFLDLMRRAQKVEAEKAPIHVDKEAFVDSIGGKFLNGVMTLASGFGTFFDPEKATGAAGELTFDFARNALDVARNFGLGNVKPLRPIIDLPIALSVASADEALLQASGLGQFGVEAGEELNDFYRRLAYTEEFARKDPLRAIAGMAGAILPIIAGARGAPGAGLANVGSNVATRALGAVSSFGISAAAFAPTDVGFGEDGVLQSDTGIVGENSTFLGSLKNQGIAGLAGGVGAAIGVFGSTLFAGILGKGIARFAGKEGATVGNGLGYRLAQSSIEIVNEGFAFGIAGEYVQSMIHGSEFDFTQTMAANLSILGLMKGAGAVVGSRAGLGRGARVGPDGRATPATGLRGVIARSLAKRAGQDPETLRAPSYQDRIGLSVEILKKAKKTGKNIDQLVAEAKKDFARSPLGDTLLKGGVGPLSSVDLELSLAYAKSGMTYSGRYGMDLLESLPLARRSINESPGHSAALESPSGAERDRARTREEAEAEAEAGRRAEEEELDARVAEAEAPPFVNDPRVEFAQSPDMPKPVDYGPEAAAVELAARGLGPEQPSGRVESSVQDNTKTQAELNAEAIKGAQEAAEALRADGLEDVVDLDPTVESTVRTLRGISDHFDNVARRAMGRLITQIKGGAQKAKGALRRLNKAVEEHGNRFRTVESETEVRGRLADFDSQLPKKTDAEVRGEIDGEVLDAFGNLSGAELRDLRFAAEMDPDGVKRAADRLRKTKAQQTVTKVKKAVLGLRRRFQRGDLDAEMLRRAARDNIQLNDVTIAFEQAAKVIANAPKNAQGLVFGGLRGLGEVGTAVKALGTSIMASGVSRFSAWRARMIEATGMKISEKQWRAFHAAAAREWERNMSAVVGRVPGLRELIKLAKEGMSGHNWYADFTAKMEPFFRNGDDPIMIQWKDANGNTVNRPAFDLFAQILAATSANATVSSNVELAVKAFVEIAKNGENARFDAKPVELVTNSVQVGGETKFVIEDPTTGEIMRSQPVVKNGKGVKRRTFFENEKEATTRKNAMNSNRKQKAPSFVGTHAKTLRDIVRRGEIDPKVDRKRHNFYKALTGDTNAVVLDVWGMRALGWYKRSEDGKPVLTKKGEVQEFEVTDWRYDHFEALVRSTADALGITPRQAQAALWAGTKELWRQKAWLDRSDTKAQDAPEASLRLKFLTRGRFRRALNIDFEKLNRLEPDLIAEFLKQGGTPEMIALHADVRRPMERKIRDKLRNCLGA